MSARIIYERDYTLIGEMSSWAGGYSFQVTLLLGFEGYGRIYDCIGRLVGEMRSEGAWQHSSIISFIEHHGIYKGIDKIIISQICYHNIFE